MPLGTRRGYVDTAIGQLHYQRAGTGAPIVLLPAASQSHNTLRNLAENLASDMEVVAIDLPGSGYSDPLPAKVDVAVIADAVAETIDALGLASPCLYGIHTGNKIAASLAARCPGKARALVLCGQTHSLIADMTLRTDRMKRVSANRFSLQADAAATQLRERLALWRELEAVWWRGDLACGLAPAQECAQAGLAIADLLLSVDSLPNLYRANFDYDLEADLRHIAMPTLIVEIATPLEDRTIGRQGSTLIAIIRDASLVTFEEPDGLGLTLENRAAALGDSIRGFLDSRRLQTNSKVLE